MVILNTCEYTTDFKRSHDAKNNALETFIRNQFRFSPCVGTIELHLAIMDVCRQQKSFTQHQKVKNYRNINEVQTQAIIGQKLNLSKTTQTINIKNKNSIIDLFKEFSRKVQKLGTTPHNDIDIYIF